MSMAGNSTDDASPRASSTIPAGGNVESGGATVVGVQISAEPLTDKFTFSPALLAEPAADASAGGATGSARANTTSPAAAPSVGSQSKPTSVEAGTASVRALGARRVLWSTICVMAGVCVGAGGWWIYQGERAASSARSGVAALAEAQQHSVAYQQQLAQERDRSKALDQELAVQLAARQSQQEALGQERAHSEDLERQLASLQNDQQALAEEQARTRLLERQLAFANLPASTLNGDPLLPETAPLTGGLRPGPTTVEAAPIEAHSADRIAASIPAPAPASSDAARLIVRAKQLLEEGDVAAARIVLQLAIETGSAPALFALAETYDPAVLSAWGTIGTQGDARKAHELYAKALAAGVAEAKDRLQELSQ